VVRRFTACAARRALPDRHRRARAEDERAATDARASSRSISTTRWSSAPGARATLGNPPRRLPSRTRAAPTVAASSRPVREDQARRRTYTRTATPDGMHLVRVVYPSNQIVDGRCPGPGHKVEWTEEESYFFRMSRYGRSALKHTATIRVRLPRDAAQRGDGVRRGGLKDLRSPRNLTWASLPRRIRRSPRTWFERSAIHHRLGYGADRTSTNRYWPAPCPHHGEGHQPVPRSYGRPS